MLALLLEAATEPPKPDQLAQADFRACISNYKPSLKKVYDIAVGSVKKVSAKAALKEHYIHAIVCLEGIAPNSGERLFQYEARQNDNKTKLASLWTRFEVEN